MPVILSIIIQVALIVHVLRTAKLAPRHYPEVQRVMDNGGHGWG